MIQVSAQYDQKQLQRLFSRIKILEANVMYYIASPADLPRQLSRAYIDLIRNTIITRMVPVGTPVYPPYNSKYAMWKKKYGKYDGFWQLMGDLYSNLGSFKWGGGYYAGIKFFARDKGGKSWFGEGNKGKSKPIAMYARVMEEGSPNINNSGVHPARPLFAPTLKHFVYSRSKKTAGDAWTIADKTLAILGRKWERGF